MPLRASVRDHSSCSMRAHNSLYLLLAIWMAWEVVMWMLVEKKASSASFSQQMFVCSISYCRCYWFLLLNMLSEFPTSSYNCSFLEVFPKTQTYLCKQANRRTESGTKAKAVIGVCSVLSIELLMLLSSCLYLVMILTWQMCFSLFLASFWLSVNGVLAFRVWLPCTSDAILCARQSSRTSRSHNTEIRKQEKTAAGVESREPERETSRKDNMIWKLRNGMGGTEEEGKRGMEGSNPTIATVPWE